MSGEQLRQFYAHCGSTFLLAYDVYLAGKGGKTSDIDTALEKLQAHLVAWQPAFDQFGKYKRDYSEFVLRWAASYYRGENTATIPEPSWPTLLPPLQEVEKILKAVKCLWETLNEDHRKREVWLTRVENQLHSLHSKLTTIDDIIHADDPEGDGPIDRNQIAILISINPKTLANKASKLPEPIARTAKGVPIFRYQEVKQRLRELYPDRAFMMPDAYSEALEQIKSRRNA